MEAIKLTPVTSIERAPQFKDGDGGGDGPQVVSLVVNVVDNGYILSAMMVDEEEIDVQEVYTTTDELLERIKELVKM